MAHLNFTAQTYDSHLLDVRPVGDIDIPGPNIFRL